MGMRYQKGSRDPFFPNTNKTPFQIKVRYKYAVQLYKTIYACRMASHQSFNICLPMFISRFIRADPEGGAGGSDPPSLKNHKNIGFLSNIGTNPL